MLTLPLLPQLHGALGWWDEIINLIPVVIGLILVAYLYRANRRRREAEDQPDAALDPETPEAPTPRP